MKINKNSMPISANNKNRKSMNKSQLKQLVRQIVKEAIGVLGGNIAFTSIENISTTFEVMLPLQLSEASD